MRDMPEQSLLLFVPQICVSVQDVVGVRHCKLTVLSPLASLKL